MPRTVPQLKTKDKSSAELKALVNNFNFWEPDWESFLSHFPHFPSGPEALRAGGQSLTPYESGLLTAIKLAYLNSHQGKIYLRKKAIKAGGVVAIAVAVIVFAQLTIASPAVNVVKSVAAATMSAILR